RWRYSLVRIVRSARRLRPLVRCDGDGRRHPRSAPPVAQPHCRRRARPLPTHPQRGRRWLPGAAECHRTDGARAASRRAVARGRAPRQAAAGSARPRSRRGADAARREGHGLTVAVGARIPVNLITGFLGSGKTTLLQRLLQSPELGTTAVLINEFGEIGLDHYLLERVDEATVLLKSGCVCCSIRGDLRDAIGDLYDRRGGGLVPPFERLVVETPGLADPVPIVTTLTADPVLCHHFRLGTIVTVVDAVNGLSNLARFEESRRQAAVADRLVISKSDIADAEAIDRLRARLGRLNPTAVQLDAAR